jgi:hypothetical protein
VVVGLAFAFAVSGALLATPAASAAEPKLASGSSEQWAFGGSAGASFSCSNTACGDGSTITHLSLFYYVAWVVIYTATNISTSQTEFEVQAAINATVSLSLAGCVNESGSGPCSDISAQANIAGREVATGFTNVTNQGSVYLDSGPASPGEVAAYAVMNADSNAAFNFSGSYTETLPVNGTTETGNFNLDLGGSEVTSVSFATPLGIVPIDPQVGQAWNASAPYSATGTYTSGYSISANLAGHTENENNWQSLSVAPSGTLSVDGSDVGTATLYDNYTSPATSVQVQVIALSFQNGAFAGSDGWLLLPSGLYGGAAGALGSFDLLGGMQHPSTTAEVGGSESAYYQQNKGFVGVNESASGSSLGLGGTGGPSFNLQAGPEPVSVAQSQYSAITSSSSGSSAFPWAWAILGVVVVLVIVVAAFLVMARSRRPPPMASPPPMVDSPAVPPPPQPPMGPA